MYSFPCNFTAFPHTLNRSDQSSSADPSSLQPAESQSLTFPTSYMAYPTPQVASPSTSSEVVTSASIATSVSIQHAAELTLHSPEATPTAPPPPPPPPPSSSHTPDPAPPAPSPTHATNNSPPHESAPQSAPPPTQNSPTDDVSSPDSSSSSGLESDMLADHNSFRAQHGASSMTWNNEMASKAQQWANGCVFKHSGGTLGPFGGKYMTPVGFLFQHFNSLCVENLAAGTGTSYSADTGFGQWTAEQCQCDSPSIFIFRLVDGSPKPQLNTTPTTLCRLISLRLYGRLLYNSAARSRSAMIYLVPALA